MNLPCKLLLILSWLCALPQAIAMPEAAVAPRAWLVTRGDAAAIVVGETHLDTALEFDPYFGAVVEPAFRGADVALVESYFGPENLANLGFNLTAPCDAAGDIRQSERIGQRFAQLAQAAREMQLEVPPWMVQWQAFPDIALVLTHLPGYIARRIAPAIETALRKPDDWSGVSFRLTNPASRGAGRQPQVTGLDTVAGTRRSFCAASAGQREDYLVNMLDSALGRMRMLEDARRSGQLANFRTGMASDLARVLACIARDVPCELAAPAVGAALRYGMSPLFTPGIFELSVQQRTRLWLPIVQEAMATHRRTFVVVGALHLADLRFQGGVHPGLLRLLRESGCVVTPIRGAGDIQEPFLRKRWWERLFAS